MIKNKLDLFYLVCALVCVCVCYAYQRLTLSVLLNPAPYTPPFFRHLTALVGLELAMYTRLVSNSQKSTCLSSKGWHHHTWHSLLFETRSLTEFEPTTNSIRWLATELQGSTYLFLPRGGLHSQISTPHCHMSAVVWVQPLMLEALFQVSSAIVLTFLKRGIWVMNWSSLGLK